MSISSMKQIEKMKQLEITKAKISVKVEKKYVDWIDSRVKTMRFSMHPFNILVGRGRRKEGI